MQKFYLIFVIDFLITYFVDTCKLMWYECKLYVCQEISTSCSFKSFIMKCGILQSNLSRSPMSWLPSYPSWIFSQFLFISNLNFFLQSYWMLLSVYTNWLWYWKLWVSLMSQIKTITSWYTLSQVSHWVLSDHHSY